MNGPGTAVQQQHAFDRASRISGTASTARYSPSTGAGPKLYSAIACTSGTWAGLPSMKTRPVSVSRLGLIGLAFMKSTNAGGQPDCGLQPHHIAVAQRNDAKRSAAQRLGRFRQRRQHRFQIECANG